MVVPLALLATLACNKPKQDSPNPFASVAGSASVVTHALYKQPRPGASARRYVPKPAPSRIPLPSGPRLAILAGQGVGPIRIGATRKTIERHMQAPCEVSSESLCRYIGRAVDFNLKNGVVDSIVVHRMDRPAGKDQQGNQQVFGIFNGALPPDFQVMMKQKVIMDHLGPPLRQEKVAEPGEFSTMERHYYEGMVVEYDRYENGQIVLGGIRIEKPKSQ